MVKQIIVVRKDLNMRKGKMCAQVAHTSFKVFLDLCDMKKTPYATRIKFTAMSDSGWEEWLTGQFTKVVVSCDSEDELKGIYQDALNHGLPCSIIKDAGKTEFHGEPTLTTVAVGPAEAEEIDKVTGHLKLI